MFSYCMIAVREHVTKHQAQCYACTCFQLVFVISIFTFVTTFM
jgi:hypothetical protein